jgi:hypothetical protein
MRFTRLFVFLLFAGCLFGRAAEEEGLVIVDAIWKGGIRESNVTSKVRERVHSDTVEFQATRDTLGDPAKGHQKMLRVTYRFHGIEHTLEVAEGRTLRLPTATADVPDTTLTGDQRWQIQRITDATKAVTIPKKGLEIVQAVFGTNGLWRDVTAIVQQGVAENRWQAELHFPYTELGGDPAKGKGKQLIIGYRLDGTPKVGIFDETKDKVIHANLP